MTGGCCRREAPLVHWGWILGGFLMSVRVGQKEVREGYGPNGLLDRVTGNGWCSSRKSQRYFKAIMVDANAVLYDHASSRFPIRYRITVDTLPHDRHPAVVEGWQSHTFLGAFVRSLRVDGIALRALRFQEIDANVSAYRVTCEVISTPQK